MTFSSFIKNSKSKIQNLLTASGTSPAPHPVHDQIMHRRHALAALGVAIPLRHRIGLRGEGNRELPTRLVFLENLQRSRGMEAIAHQNHPLRSELVEQRLGELGATVEVTGFS